MLTTTEAAALLGIKPAMARRYCDKGRLKAVKVGRNWITTREAVETFKATMKKAGRPKKTNN